MEILEQSAVNENRPSVGQGHPFAVIVKPTDRCNMACHYCYVTHKACVPSMTSAVLSEVIRKTPWLAGQGRRLHFIWHGGEPLTMGVKFFESVVSFQQEFCKGREYDNCVQTNGTLLNPTLLKFFVEHRFAISLSLDGPPDVHDRYRIFPNGSGTHASVLRAIDLLRKQGQLIGAVAVLTAQSTSRIPQIYQTMKELGVQFRINPVIAPNGENSELQVDPDEYGRAICELFDLWFEDKDPPHIDPIHLVVGNMMTSSVWGCDYHGGCLKDVIAVNPDGGVYPCGQLAGHPEFYMGTIFDDPEEIFSCPIAKRILERPTKMRANCADCDFVGICGGGCMASAWLKSRDIYGRDYFCAGREKLFRHVRRRLMEEFTRIRGSQNDKRETSYETTQDSE